MKLKAKNNCSIFVTAGYPELNSAVKIVPELEKAGVDLVELGIPFSDPLADGETIQEASAIALKNGMTLDILFEQLKEIKKQTRIPIVLMGYFNPILRYGVAHFLARCAEFELDGLIIPDLSPEIVEAEHAAVFKKYGVPLIFLITPETPVERVRKIESFSKAFIYLVSSASTTGGKKGFSNEQVRGFQKIARLSLSVPVLIGFGIHDHQTFSTVCNHSQGAIIGSAFIRSLAKREPVSDFVKRIIQE